MNTSSIETSSCLKVLINVHVPCSVEQVCHYKRINKTVHNSWEKCMHYLVPRDWLFVGCHCPCIADFANIYLLQLTFMNGTRFVLQMGPVSYNYLMYYIHEESYPLENVDDIMWHMSVVLFGNCHCWLFNIDLSSMVRERMFMVTWGMDLISTS